MAARPSHARCSPDASSRGQRPLWEAALSGSVGGVLCTVVGHPLDTIKVRLQTGQQAAPGRAALRGLFAGVASPLVGVTPYWMLKYWAYRHAQELQQRAAGPGSLPGVLGAACSGLYSGLLSGGLRGVLDNVKANAQVRNECSWRVAQSIWQYEGLRGLSRGMSTSVAYNAFAQALYFSSYEWTNARLGGSVESPMLQSFIAGSVAGLLMWVPNLPVDIVRQQLYVGTHDSPKVAARAIWTQHGLRGFYRGFWPTVLRAMPANGAALTGVTQAELLLDWLRRGGEVPMALDWVVDRWRNVDVAVMVDWLAQKQFT